MKKTLFLIIFFCLASISYADGGLKEVYKPNERFDLSLHLRNATGDVNGANCSIQIRNSSFNIITNDIMREINNGYYNYTYNTSRTGNYLCRQNCTQGTQYTANTCDFIIKGDEKVSIAISIIIMGMLALFIIIAINLSAREHFALKLFFLILAMLTLLLGINFAHKISIDNGLSQQIQDMLSIQYRIGIYGFFAVMAYIVIYLLWFTFKKAKEIPKRV